MPARLALMLRAYLMHGACVQAVGNPVSLSMSNTGERRKVECV